MIRISGVSKSYFNKSALKKATMNLEKGKIIGLLGPNGSGKTTLLRILASELRADEGEIRIDDQKLSSTVKGRISSLTSSDFMQDSLTLREGGKEYENFFRDFDMKLYLQLLKEVDLAPDLKIKNLSKGMKSKFALAITVARRARLIVLDEPLDGVDPVAREEILALIGNAFSAESTILVTSHLINELEQLLDEVYFITDGEVRYMGEVESIREKRGQSLDELYREVYRR